MERLRFLSNVILAASIGLLAVALMTRVDLPTAQAQGQNEIVEGVIALTAQGTQGENATFVLWLVDTNRKRMSYYECNGRTIQLKGARNLKYDFFYSEFPGSTKDDSVVKFRDLYIDAYQKNNKGEPPPEDMRANKGPDEGGALKLLAVAGNTQSKSSASFLWLVETTTRRIACYLPEGNRGIKMVGVRSYTYEHEVIQYPPYEFPTSPSGDTTVKKLKEEYDKENKDKDKDKDAGGKAGGS
ncbi:MAG: hypothetical protein HYZ53_05160 [Planctomycetes bacterium]|nr:hypothetical protein [Planctomycetota bacterium]